MPTKTSSLFPDVLAAKHDILGWTMFIVVLRNRKDFPCFHAVVETRVKVCENEKLNAISSSLKLPRVFPLRMGTVGENVFYFFYKITCTKLKRRNNLFYQVVISQYCSILHAIHTIYVGGIDW